MDSEIQCIAVGLRRVLMGQDHEFIRTYTYGVSEVESQWYQLRAEPVLVKGMREFLVIHRKLDVPFDKRSRIEN